MKLKQERVQFAGEELNARELSLAEFSAFSDYDDGLEHKSAYAKGMARAFWILSRALLAHDGTPRFSVEELEGMGQSSAPDIARAYQVIWRLSGLSDEAVEAERKNSETAPTASI
jgi:hypothetical protein